MNIGITCGGTGSIFKINKAYINYIRNAGFNPIVLTPDTSAKEVVKFCDGLILSGGVDLEPTYYGEDNLASMSIDIVRDEFERNILNVFMRHKKKVFGICRGFQLIARTLLQKLNDPELIFYQHINKHSLANDRNIDRNIPAHRIFSNKHMLYGEKEYYCEQFVNSMHHQALLSTKNNVSYTAPELILNISSYTKFGLSEKNAENTSIIESFTAIYKGCPLKGVQWHPEELNDVKLIQYFFKKETFNNYDRLENTN